MKSVYQYILVGTIMLSAISSVAQPLTQSNFYVNNLTWVNSAFAGYDKGAEAALGYQKQMIGINQSPSTVRLSFQNSINRPDLDKLRELPPSSNRQIRKGYDDGLRNFIGYSGMLTVNTSGLFTHTKLMVSGAYHLKVSRRSMVSFSPMLSYSNYRVDANSMDLIDVNDPAHLSYQSDNRAQNSMQIGFAAAYYMRGFAFGISAKQLADVKFTEANFDVPYNQDIDITTSYKYMVNADIQIMPIVNAKIQSKQPVLVDATVVANYKKFVWAGLGYSSIHSISALAGVKLDSGFNVGYGFNSGNFTHLVKNVSNHELYLSYSF